MTVPEFDKFINRRRCLRTNSRSSSKANVHRSTLTITRLTVLRPLRTGGARACRYLRRYRLPVVLIVMSNGELRRQAKQVFLCRYYCCSARSDIEQKS